MISQFLFLQSIGLREIFLRFKVKYLDIRNNVIKKLMNELFF